MGCYISISRTVKILFKGLLRYFLAHRQDSL